MRRHRHVTVHGEDLQPTLYLHSESTKPGKGHPLVRQLRKNYAESDCLRACMEKDNCHAVQAVYASDVIDDAGFIKDVKWCILLEVKAQGADIVRHSGDMEHFQFITDWMHSEGLDVDTTKITNDLQTHLIGVIVKGKSFTFHLKWITSNYLLAKILALDNCAES